MFCASSDYDVTANTDGVSFLSMLKTTQNNWNKIKLELNLIYADHPHCASVLKFDEVVLIHPVISKKYMLCVQKPIKHDKKQTKAFKNEHVLYFQVRNCINNM